MNQHIQRDFLLQLYKLGFKTWLQRNCTSHSLFILLKLCKAKSPFQGPLCGQHDISQQSSTIRVLHDSKPRRELPSGQEWRGVPWHFVGFNTNDRNASEWLRQYWKLFLFTIQFLQRALWCICLVPLYSWQNARYEWSCIRTLITSCSVWNGTT